MQYKPRDFTGLGSARELYGRQPTSNGNNAPGHYGLMQQPSTPSEPQTDKVTEALTQLLLGKSAACPSIQHAERVRAVTNDGRVIELRRPR